MDGINPHRGEISADLGGKTYRLCLTLGALAELEHALGAADLMALAERFECGRLSAREAICIIGAGLRGGGAEMSNDEVARQEISGGAAGYIRLVARLLAATFPSSALDETREGSAERKENPPDRPSPAMTSDSEHCCHGMT